MQLLHEPKHEALFFSHCRRYLNTVITQQLCSMNYWRVQTRVIRLHCPPPLLFRLQLAHLKESSLSSLHFYPPFTSLPPCSSSLSTYASAPPTSNNNGNPQTDILFICLISTPGPPLIGSYTRTQLILFLLSRCRLGSRPHFYSACSQLFALLPKLYILLHDFSSPLSPLCTHKKTHHSRKRKHPHAYIPIFERFLLFWLEQDYKWI